MLPHTLSPCDHARHAALRRTVLALPAALSLPLVLQAAAFQIPEAPPMDGRIIYTRGNTASSDFAIDVFASDANGENEVQLTVTDDLRVYGSRAGEDRPRWSPDGREIAFVSPNKDGVVSIWRMPYAGGTPTPVVRDDGVAGDPAWHPDEDCMAYSGARHGAGDSILDLKIWCSGSGVRVLTSTSDRDERDPDWSPDGNKIVYSARRPPRSLRDVQHWRLRIMNADGSDDEELLAWEGKSLRHPRWSPDGQSIAFIGDHPNGIGMLAILDLATRRVDQVATKAAGQLTWSPDGRMILFYNTGAEGPVILPQKFQMHGGPDQQDPNQGEQLLGLFVIDLAERRLMRLRGAAGGASAPLSSFSWGYSPDWSAGTIAPTPTTSNTPTPTTRSTPTPTTTPMPTHDPRRINFLPIVYKSAAARPPEPSQPNFLPIAYSDSSSDGSVTR